ncbi:hypothetical protein Sa4125_37110 [Aureimonas sp. SA4125]|uniref:DUF924 family protein n=1 Tax=Aureimonas sp. SA4125 TaxID=2826993 RepID=UPI001CC59105|nr:DUF924 family protein [Aureimonas sp. SA4125]BDA86169.1 hypothetical protein Sa4125_37110 [Aureimonas sp. SA4125]
MSETFTDPQTIIDFWREAGPDRWFFADADFDSLIRQRFLDIYERAALGELDSWTEEPNGALALVLLLDQFPRNMFRGHRRMYQTDAKALHLAREALARGDHLAVGDDVNQFLVLPLMHAEDLAMQDACVALMEEVDPDNLSFAHEHRETVRRFGRFPHRNVILGRPSSEEELEFLKATQGTDTAHSTKS